MTTDATNWPAYVDAMSALQRLPLDAERRAAVIQQLTQIEILARRITEFPLPPELEPAPVFRP
jgi:hypothetical protein